MTATPTAARPWIGQPRSSPQAGRPPAGRVPSTGPATIAYVLISAVLRGVVAALAGVLLVGGLALLVWAITPATGSNAGGLLRSSMVILSAGHFLPATVAGAAVTIHPLAVTLIAVLVIASSASRGRAVRGRSMEAVHGLVLAVAYAATIDLVVRSLVPADEVGATMAPLLVAGFGVVLGLATHRTAWNRWWRRTAPAFLRIGLRAGSAAVCVLLAAGAVALAAGLAAHLHDALAVARLTAPGAGDGFALTLLSLAFLPNAILAGAGYLTGSGFTIGAASYSPFGSTAVQLPAIPLLTATPDGHPAGRAGLLVLAVPVLVGVLVAVWIDRRLDLRWQRMAAAGCASVIAGAGLAGIAAAAAGGVSGGPWSTTGVPPAVAAIAVGGVLAVVSLAWTGVAGLRSVPWRAERPAPADADASTGSDDGTGADPAERDDDAAAVREGADGEDEEDEEDDAAAAQVDEGAHRDADLPDADIGETAEDVEPAEGSAPVEVASRPSEPDDGPGDDPLSAPSRAVADPSPDADQAFPAAESDPPPGPGGVADQAIEDGREAG